MMACIMENSTQFIVLHDGVFSFSVLGSLGTSFRILKSIQEKKLSVAINAPIGPFLFIIGNILGFILVMNVLVAYGLAVYSMTSLRYIYLI